MLSSATYGNVNGAFNQVIDLLGAQMTWTSVKSPATATFVAGFSSMGKTDTELINAYGIASKVITAKASSFSTPPAKFDKFVVNNEHYVAAAVHPIHINTTLVGWKIILEGK
jgi:hypothetical protein